MHVWKIGVRNANWEIPVQSIYVVTEEFNINEAIETAEFHVTCEVNSVEYVAEAYKKPKFISLHD